MTSSHPALAYNEEVALATPYKRARQDWDERIGSARVQAANWRLIAFGLLFLVLFCLGIVIWQQTQSHIVPYVVEISEVGHIRSITKAHQGYTPKDHQVAFHLAHFITLFRSLSSDPVVVRNNWLKLYHYVSNKAATTVTDYARKSDPFKDIGTLTRAIEVLSVVRASHNSFQLRWQEKSFVNGSLEHKRQFTALLTLVLKPPTDKQTLLNNPLGLFITDFHWSRDLDTGENK